MSNSQRILEILKHQGSATAAEIAKQLKMTSMGARQHLLQLQSKQLVSHFQKSEKVGRPSQYWKLTKQAHLNFGDSHSQLAANLIQHISVVFGDQGLGKILRSREQAIETEYLAAISAVPDIKTKLQVLSELRSNEGYMASWESKEDHYLFIEHHCPICDAAMTCQQICASERNLFGKCFQEVAFVERTEHILQGQQRCTYKITPIKAFS